VLSDWELGENLWGVYMLVSAMLVIAGAFSYRNMLLMNGNAEEMLLPSPLAATAEDLPSQTARLQQAVAFFRLEAG